MKLVSAIGRLWRAALGRPRGARRAPAPARGGSARRGSGSASPRSSARYRRAVCGSGSAASSRRSASRSWWYCAERLLAAAGRGEQPHQRAVGRLVQRVDHHGLLERLDRRRRVAVRGQAGGELEQQPEVRLAQRLAPAGRPRLVAVLGQQLAAVERERRAVVRPARRSRARAAAAASKASTSTSTAPARVQREHVVAQREHGRGLGAGRLERPPGDVQRLMEVVGRRLGVALGPQQLGRPLAVDPALGRQREQLHQALGLAQPPRALGHHLVADANGEGAEQPDPDNPAHGVLTRTLRERPRVLAGADRTVTARGGAASRRGGTAQARAARRMAKSGEPHAGQWPSHPGRPLGSVTSRAPAMVTFWPQTHQPCGPGSWARAAHRP